MTRAERFNASGFGRWINSPVGRVFRLLAGGGFARFGYRHRDTAAGKAALIWSFFPLTAGAFDLCWISAALGGPLRGNGSRAEAVPSLRAPWQGPRLERERAHQFA